MADVNLDDVKPVIDYIERYTDVFLDYLPNLVIAFIVLFIGMWMIRMVKGVARKVFIRRNLDVTLKKFLLDIITWSLRILLFIVVISQLGIQTTSLVAMIGAAGLAIGMALQGSLANFAGGVLIMLFRPFRIGDSIVAQGQDGTVKEITIFYTKLITSNNQLVILPNGKLSNDPVVNFTTEGKRRAVMTIGISYDSDIKLARQILVDLMKEQKNILKEPEPVVYVAELADSSVNLSVRFWALNKNYWSSYFYTLEEAKTRLEAAGISIPFPQRDVHHYNLEGGVNK